MIPGCEEMEDREKVAIALLTSDSKVRCVTLKILFTPGAYSTCTSLTYVADLLEVEAWVRVKIP